MSPGFFGFSFSLLVVLPLFSFSAVLMDPVFSLRRSVGAPSLASGDTHPLQWSSSANTVNHIGSPTNYFHVSNQHGQHGQNLLSARSTRPTIFRLSGHKTPPDGFSDSNYIILTSIIFVLFLVQCYYYLCIFISLPLSTGECQYKSMSSY